MRSAALEWSPAFSTALIRRPRAKAPINATKKWAVIRLLQRTLRSSGSRRVAERKNEKRMSERPSESD